MPVNPFAQALTAVKHEGLLILAGRLEEKKQLQLLGTETFQP
jgi:hypothetical protein